MRKYWSVLLLGGVFVAALLLCILLNTAWSNLWLLGMGADEWAFFTGWAAAFLLVVFLAMGCIQLWPKSKAAVILVLILLIGAMLMVAFAQYAFRADSEYRIYTSDDGQHTLIVEVESFLLNSWGTFYQQTSPVTREKIGAFNLGDYYPDVEFAFIWRETGCTATFCGQTVVLEWVQ